MPRRGEEQSQASGKAWFVQVITYEGSSSSATAPQRAEDEQDARSKFSRQVYHNTNERRTVILTTQEWSRGPDGFVTWKSAPVEVEREDTPREVEHASVTA